MLYLEEVIAIVEVRGVDILAGLRAAGNAILLLELLMQSVFKDVISSDPHTSCP